MNSPLFSRLASILSELSRFPLPIGAALIATAASIVSIHSSDTTTDEHCLRISLSMLAGLPLLIGAVYAAELYPRGRRIFQACALAATVGAFLLLPSVMHSGAGWFRFRMLVLMAFAVASAVPGLIPEGGLNWWRVNVGWLNSLVLAFIMTAIVEIGLQLALLSVEKLFGLEARYGKLMLHLHEDLFAMGGLLIGPVTALALSPPAKGELHAEQAGFRVWANLCKWALIPIGFLFMGILAAYSAKILIQWKLPNGMVATPVLSLGAYGTLAMLLTLPWRAERIWARWFSLIYPPSFLLSSILLFISLALRMKEYGVTFDRYSALAAGIWLTFSAVCFLIRWKQTTVAIPLVLALIAMVAALGPLSAGTLSLRSQSERLKHLLESTSRQDEQFRSIVRMIIQDFGLSDLEKVTGSLGLDPKLTDWQLTDAALQKLHVTRTERTATNYDLPEGTSVPITGCTAYLTGAPGSRNASIPCLLGKNAAGEELLLKTITPGDLKLVLHAGAREIASKRIDELDFEEARKSKTPLLITLAGEGCDRVFLVLITHAQWQRSGKPRKVTSIEYQIFEKQPDHVKDRSGDAASPPPLH